VGEKSGARKEKGNGPSIQRPVGKRDFGTKNLDWGAIEGWGKNTYPGIKESLSVAVLAMEQAKPKKLDRDRRYRGERG